MLGINAKLYRNTGTYGSPTWAELDLVSECQIKLTWEEADASCRRTRIKLAAKTLLGLEVTTKVRADLTDAGYQALVLALHLDTVIDLLVLNGSNTTNGVQGWRCDFSVMAGDEDQSTGTVLYNGFTFKPTTSSNTPQSVLVTAGAPVYTALGT